MKKEYDLKNIGIDEPLELFGSLTNLSIYYKAPIVFLFDEHHGNKNDCIIKNIENAKSLINNVNIALIGVESLAGGTEWDEETGDYVTDDLNEKYYKEVIINGWKNNCTTFCDALSINNSHLIIGVESVGMMNKIEVDIYNDNPADISNAITNHPLSKLRSKHFIKTLLEHYSSKQLTGNLILNCGSNHNEHIEEWIKGGEIDEIVGVKATYVRINNF